MAVPVRPLEEQRTIADYLDREIARIDTLIEEQQRLIEMLRERREAMIRSALLSGLAANKPRHLTGPPGSPPSTVATAGTVS